VLVFTLVRDCNREGDGSNEKRDGIGVRDEKKTEVWNWGERQRWGRGQNRRGNRGSVRNGGGTEWEWGWHWSWDEMETGKETERG
jgi:hypothetical protein